MKTRQLLLTLIAVLGSVTIVLADPIEEGKLIFNSRCAACHNVNKTLTGPALAGLDQRRSMEWIVKFVQSSQALVKNGDKDAVDIFQKFNKVPMPDHPDLTAEHIKGIVEFIKSETVTEDAKAPFAKPGKKMSFYQPLSITGDYGLFAGFLFVVFLLVMALLFVVRLRGLRVKDEDA